MLPAEDLVDVPEEAKPKLKFVPVENIDEVLNAALEKKNSGDIGTIKNCELTRARHAITRGV